VKNHFWRIALGIIVFIAISASGLIDYSFYWAKIFSITNAVSICWGIIVVLFSYKIQSQGYFKLGLVFIFLIPIALFACLLAYNYRMDNYENYTYPSLNERSHISSMMY